MEVTRSRDRRKRRGSVAQMRLTPRYVGRSRLPYRVHVSDAPEVPADGQRELGSWSRYLSELTSRPGWSVTRLAQESGLHRSTIYRWRGGDVRNVTIDSVKAVAHAVGDDETDALRAAGDAVANGPSNSLRQLTNLGQFVLENMARLGIQRPDDLAEAAGLKVDQITAVMFEPDLEVDSETFDRLADILKVGVDDLGAAVAEDALAADGGTSGWSDGLVDEVCEVLRPDSPVTEAERRSFRAFLELALAPIREKYGRELNDRKAS